MSCLIRFERFAVFLLAGVVLASCSSSSGAMEDEGNEGPKLLAHRGIHQTFSTEGVDDETCTATKIDPPLHGYIENTIISGPDGAGIDSPADLADVPSDIDVYVWTNRVDAIT